MGTKLPKYRNVNPQSIDKEMPVAINDRHNIRLED